MRMVRWKVSGPLGVIYTDPFDMDNLVDGKEPLEVSTQRREAALAVSNANTIEVSFHLESA